MIDQLKKRVCIMSNRCYMCKVQEESAYHLLLHCLSKYPVVAGILSI